MIVSVKLKALSKKRPIIDSCPITIPDHIRTADELVSAIVRQNVQDFNRQATDKPLFPYLTKESMENMEIVGKIGFADKKNENPQDEDEAVRNALECFQDGLFRVFINADEVVFAQEIHLQEGDELIFMKVTMLAGRLW